MAKKLIAVTAIRHNGEDMPANEPVDTSKFTKEELKALYDAGSVRVEDDGNNGPDTSVNAEAASPENPTGQDAQQVGDVSAAAKGETTPQAMAATPQGTAAQATDTSSKTTNTKK
jgi:hypothetical protein